MASSAASSGLTTLPSCRLGKPSDGNPPPLTQGRLYYGKLLPSALRAATVSRGRTRAAPLPTHLLRICAGALFFTPSVLPPMFHRTAIQLPLHRGGYNKVTPSAPSGHLPLWLPKKICLSKDFLGRGAAGIKALPRRRRGWRNLPCGDEVTPSAASSGLTTPPSCRLGKPSDGNPPPLTQGRLKCGKIDKKRSTFPEFRFRSLLAQSLASFCATTSLPS